MTSVHTRVNYARVSRKNKEKREAFKFIILSLFSIYQTI